MKNTQYYVSGRHTANARLAQKKGNAAQKSNAMNRRNEYLKNPIICIVCNGPHPYNKRKNKACSASCGTTIGNLNRSVESRQKQRRSICKTFGVEVKEKEINIRTTLQKPPKPPKSYRFTKIFLHECKICNKRKYIRYSERTRATCGSDDCKVQASVWNRPYQNGSRKPVRYYNIHEGKDVLLESSWEVRIAKLLDEKHIKWIRPRFIKWIDEHGKIRRYFPDFYLPDHNIYLDPKNPYCMTKDKFKMSQVSKEIDLTFGPLEVIIQRIESITGSNSVW